MSVDIFVELERERYKDKLFFPALALYRAVAAILAPQ